MSSFAESVSLHRVPCDAADAGRRNPYDAWALDPDTPLTDDEIRIDVTSINLDSTSARQLVEKTRGNEIAFFMEILRITRERGKMHNPSTNSGGVLSGTVAKIGKAREGEIPISAPVITLVSNTLVPLRVEKVLGFDRKTHQVDVIGSAVLPRFARYARVPEHLPLPVALSLFDVCGVVPQVERMSREGSRVVILGASGRAGLLATYAASRSVGESGAVIAVIQSESERSALWDAPGNIRILVKDARNVSELADGVRSLTDGKYGDVVVDCTNVTGVEIGAAACCRSGGIVYFFNMATRFQAAALGAELVNRDIQYVIGYGLLPEAEKKALDLFDSEPTLRRKFEEG